MQPDRLGPAEHHVQPLGLGARQLRSTWLDGGASTWTTSPSAYSQLSVSFTTGASQTSAKIYVHGWYAQGTYYADDISLDGPGGGGGSDTQAPTAPTNLTSTGKTSSSVSLSWGASSDNVGVTAYDIYSGSNQVLSVSGTSATVSGLASSTAYTFTVKARDAAGNTSGASNSVSVTTDAAVAAAPASSRRHRTSTSAGATRRARPR